MEAGCESYTPDIVQLFVEICAEDKDRCFRVLLDAFLEGCLVLVMTITWRSNYKCK